MDESCNGCDMPSAELHPVTGYCPDCQAEAVRATELAEQERSFSPALARRVLRSRRQNADLVSDLDALTCRLAADEGRTYTTTEAREVAARAGVSFDEQGWVVTR